MRNKPYQHLLIASLFVLIPIFILRLENRREWIFQLVLLLPYLLCAVFAFLGEKLNQRRIVMVGLLVGISLFYLNFTRTSVTEAERARILALSIPLILAALFSCGEKLFRGWRIGPAVAVMTLPLLALHLAALNRQPSLAPLWQWHFPGLSASFFPLPHASLLPTLAFLVLIALASETYMQIFRLYVLASLAPIGFALQRAMLAARNDHTPESALCFFCAAALLTYGVFHLYWRKVYLDELMGIPNRRALNERLSSLEGQYAIAMVDIDHFKRFNDTYGHEQGDTVLKFVASHLAHHIHGEAYRYGGEEIAIIFDGKATSFGASEMDSVRDSLAKREFRIRSGKEVRKKTSFLNRSPEQWGGTSVNVTVSVGVASFSRAGQRPEEVLSAADQALYRAKQSGRNKVVAVEDIAVEKMKAA